MTVADATGAAPGGNQAQTDLANAEFWNELCGTSLARHLGISSHEPESLRRFDDFYLKLYPYLLDRVPVRRMSGQRVLEIGLGYGTLGQQIAASGADYTGLDIADGPVRMMNHRLRMLGHSGGAQQGNMLDCPLPDASMQSVVSIGCFHHTGDTQRCIDQTWRVLEPGGTAYVMVYNQFSYRRWIGWPGATWQALLRDVGLSRTSIAVSDAERRAYDADGTGRSAPETDFFSIRQVRAMFSRFREVSVRKENCDPLVRGGKILIERETLLPLLGRAWGLDLYVEATK